MANFLVRTAISAAILSLVACASHVRSSVVDARMILPEGARRVELQQDEIFLMPVPISAPLPASPAGIADEEWTTTAVCVELVVSAEGDVVSASPLAGPEDCTGATSGVRMAFMEEAMKTVRTWTYFGAAICRPSSPKDENCEADDSVVRPVPVKLAYAFTLERSSGSVATVRAANISALPLSH